VAKKEWPHKVVIAFHREIGERMKKQESNRNPENHIEKFVEEKS
jgi:hypothetical protein